ncbi:caspase family protein [candidate division WOR-3 bacterium]|nr:caspase family protein [candidate division WOR-3 bacterium]
MKKSRFLIFIVGFAVTAVTASAGLSVGLSGGAGYADWVGVWGIAWEVAPVVYWNTQSGIFGIGLKVPYGNANLKKPDPTLARFSHLAGIVSARFYPSSFFFLEAGGGYGRVHLKELRDIHWLEHLPPPNIPSPVIEGGLGFRLSPKRSNLTFEIGLKTHMFFDFRYRNVSLELGVAYDLEGKPRDTTLVADKTKEPKPPKDGKARKLPPTLKISLALDEPSGNKALDAEETGFLVIDLANHGPGIAEDITVKVSSLKQTPGLAYEGTKTVKYMGVDGKEEIRIPIKVAADVKSRIDTLFVEVEEPRFHNNVLPTPIAFQVFQFAPPELAMSDQVGIHDEANPKYGTYGNGDSRIQAGETVLITAVVENRGAGAARDVNLSLTSNTPNVIVLDTVYEEIGTLRSGGGWDSLSFLVLIPTIVKSDSIYFNVKLEEERDRFSRQISWALPMNAELPTEVVMVSPYVEDGEVETELPKFLSDVDFINPKNVEARTDAVAVVVGASSYENRDVADVEYARRDMSAVREHLVNVLGFKKENVYSVSDPTLSDFATWFGTETNPQGKLYRRVAAQQIKEVFVYYSGHGVPSITTGDPYLVPVDCDPNYAEQGGYSLKQLYNNLKELQVDQVTVVIDACFSGSSPEGSLLKSASPLIMESIDFKTYTPPGFTALTAASGRQVANWLEGEQHGLFTYYFLKGLGGEADNGDRKLTWGEVKAYVESNVTRAAAAQDREQTPVFVGNETEVLTEWR